MGRKIQKVLPKIPKIEQFDQLTDDTEVPPEEYYFGNHIPFMFIKGKPLFTIGPHFPLFMITFLAFQCVGWWVFSLSYSKSNDSKNYLAPLIVTICHGFFYALTGMLNPGILFKPEIRQFDEEVPIPTSYCQICRVRNMRNREHCTDCGVCIEEVDHHCPWTGKCVAKNNICPFYLFILFTIIFFIVIFSTVATI